MPKENPYGDVLIELESGLIDHVLRVDDGIAEPYPYTHKQFRACIFIFMGSLLWKLREHMDSEDFEKKVDSVEKAGVAIRDLVFKFTGIDTHKLYDD